MALRYALPAGCVLAEPRAELVPAPALRPASVVEYRAGAAPGPFVAEVLERPLCKVVGETGCGKSSVVPKLLAGQTGATVFCVAAHPLLAYSGHKFFLEKPSHGVAVEGLKGMLLKSRVDVVEPGSLVWAGAAAFVAWLASRPDQEGGPLRGCIVVLDEAHECDAYTHVVRSLSLALGADNLVLMSATFDADVATRKKSLVRESTFAAGSDPRGWDVADASKPWSVAQMRSCAAVFIDSGSAASYLAGAYRRAGCDAHRLTSRSTEREYDAALAAIANRRGAVVVLLLDSSYRSGFNFDVSNIVDTGDVYYMDDDTTKLQYCCRRMYHGECAQTMGRGGRFMTAVDYSRPEGELQYKVCHLLPAEAEAAAYLFRCLGFRPVGELSAVYMAHDELPRSQDAVAALCGVYPLPRYTRTAEGVRREGVKSLTPPPRMPSPVVRAVPSPVARAHSPVVASAAAALKVAASPQCEEAGGLAAHGEGERAADVLGLRGGAGRRESGASLDSETTQVGASGSGAERRRADADASVDGGTENLQGADVWAAVLASVEKAKEGAHAAGRYLYCPAVKAVLPDAMPASLSRGHKSVLAMHVDGRLEGWVLGARSSERKMALFVLLREYNDLSLEIASMQSAITRAVGNRMEVLADSSVRRKLTPYIERVQQYDSQRRALYEASTIVAGARYVIEELVEMHLEEAERHERYLEKFRRIVRARKDPPERHVELQNARNLPLLWKGGTTAGESRRLPAMEVRVRPWTGVSGVIIDAENNSVSVRPSRLMRKVTGVQEMSLHM